MEQASSIKEIFKVNYLPLRNWANQKKSKKLKN